MKTIVLLTVIIALISSLLLGLFLFRKNILVRRRVFDNVIFEIYQKNWYYEKLVCRHWVRHPQSAAIIEKKLIEKYDINTKDIKSWKL